MRWKYLIFILMAWITVDGALSAHQYQFIDNAYNYSLDSSTTKYILLTPNTTVENAHISIKNQSLTTYCYQETANASTLCGGLSTGKYLIVNGSSTAGFLYINYSKPINALSAVWIVNHGNKSTYEINLDTWCFNQNIIQLRFSSLVEAAVGNANSQPQCYNGSTFINIANATSGSGTGAGTPRCVESNMYDGDWTTGCVWSEAFDQWANTQGGTSYKAYVREEAINWTLRGFPQDIILKTNSTMIFNNTGNLTGTNSSIDMNADYINTFLIYNNTLPLIITGNPVTSMFLYDLDIEYKKYLIINFTASTSGEVWFVNYSKHTFSGTGLRIATDDFHAAPKVTVFYNSNNQTFVYTPDYTTYYNDIFNLTVTSSLLTTDVDIWVTDGYEPVPSATVQVFKGYMDTIIDQKVTNVDGKTTVSINTDQTYYVCASKAGYTQTGNSCVAVLDPTVTYKLTLQKPTGHVPTPPTPTPTTPTVNATPRINITLVADQFTTTRQRNIGILVMLVLAVIMSVIMENRVQGYGKATFAIVLMLFGSVFHILLLPALIIAIYMILPFFRRFMA